MAANVLLLYIIILDTSAKANNENICMPTDWPDPAQFS